MNFISDKNILSYLFTIVISVNFVIASCGSKSCGSHQNPKEEPVKGKSSALVTHIPESGDIEGFVITSCGICGFGFRGVRGCSLTIKIGDKVYPVEGTSIRKHGDPHSKEGFCNAIRIAYVSGKMKKNKFYSDSFTLIESPQ
tara:strand:+ start:235 stop:660 length:426 start_codon:yes stop_codon:yes gene_type:complete